jgi:hypothetical protein
MSKEGYLGNREAQGRLRGREKLKEEVRRADLAVIMVLPEGRRFMYDLVFERCRLMGIYDGQDSGIYRSEGRRSLGAELCLELQAQHTDMYILMVTERMRSQVEDSVVRDANTKPTGEDDA